MPKVIEKPEQEAKGTLKKRLEVEEVEGLETGPPLVQPRETSLHDSEAGESQAAHLSRAITY